LAQIKKIAMPRCGPVASTRDNLTRCDASIALGGAPVPFPHHDRHWVATLKWLQDHYRDADSLLAPDEFAEPFPVVHRYEATCDLRRPPFDWVVLHKGLLERLHPTYLAAVRREVPAVFANEVFVVLTKRDVGPLVPGNSDHLRSLHAMAGEREKRPPPESQDRRIIARPPMWRLATEQIREEMNARFRNQKDDAFGGYEHEHLWDRVRYRDVDEAFRELLGPVEGKSILELACGLGRNVPMLEACDRYLGIDLSDVAIERAARKFAGRPNLAFWRTDAVNSGLPEAAFDAVLAIEIIEHVHDPERLMAESFRLLKPGGRFLINSANRDSLHLRMLRALGLPEFKATIEHIREFGFAEMTAILEGIGFRITASRGIFLLPYYGIPDVDQPVRHLTDDDPAIVEVFRCLGQRAGAEFAYEFIVAAERPA
jgi:SAM-dependent methyltransferase